MYLFSSKHPPLKLPFCRASS